ncbi:hypothetical protein DYGSA30_32640 [Dyella sp. GSA-30]|nr:hypothetical protein DYGSA30_32640 [Dyella sp. GSA-30]
MTQTLRDQIAAMVREGVHKSICRRIVGLPHIAQGASYRRKTDKAIQRHVTAGFVEIEGAGHLGAQHLAQLLLRFLDDKTIPDHAGTVDDTVQALELFRNAAYQLRQGSRVGDIDGVIAHDGAERFQLANIGLDAIVQRRTTGQDQHRIPNLACYVARKDQAQATGAARDQVNALRLPR